MAKLNLTTGEFADLMIVFLFDAMVNPEDVIVDNERFHELVHKMDKMGIKPNLTKYFLDMNATERLQYKRMKRTLEPGATTKSVIEINPPDVKIQKKSGLSKIAKTVLKKLILQGEIVPSDQELIIELKDLMEGENNG